VLTGSGVQNGGQEACVPEEKVRLSQDPEMQGGQVCLQEWREV